MRTAPVGLAFETGQLAFQYGAEFAAITHGHPSGYLSAGFLAELIFHLVRGVSLDKSILRSRKTLVEYRDHEETLTIVDRACDLAKRGIPTLQGIKSLGEGWIGEEALAISIFCSLRYQDDWKAGVLAAVNHSGDSDSIGSITGAILGTLLGKDAIPTVWIQKLENSRHIELLAVYMYKTFSPYFLSKIGHYAGRS
jgi:ADP-ribosylglycohydrolase